MIASAPMACARDRIARLILMLAVAELLDDYLHHLYFIFVILSRTARLLPHAHHILGYMTSPTASSSQQKFRVAVVQFAPKVSPYTD